MVFANPTPPIDSIVRKLSCADHKWKSMKITTVWVGPYTPNLVLHNEIRKRARNWGNILLPYEVEAAEYYMRIIDESKDKLMRAMTLNHMTVLNLELQHHHLTRSADSDGLHLGAYHKNRLFGTIIDKSISMHRSGPPNVPEIGLPLCPELREAMTEARRQKRKMRRTRAAERAVYQAADDENRRKLLKTSTSDVGRSPSS